VPAWRTPLERSLSQVLGIRLQVNNSFAPDRRFRVPDR